MNRRRIGEKQSALKHKLTIKNQLGCTVRFHEGNTILRIIRIYRDIACTGFMNTNDSRRKLLVTMHFDDYKIVRIYFLL